MRFGLSFAWMLTSLLLAACSSSNEGDLTQPIGQAGSDGGDDAYNASKTPRLAQDLTINEVAFFQAVKVSVAKDGGEVVNRNSPIVAGRKALVRVYVTGADSWVPRKITAELKVQYGEEEHWFVESKQPAPPSNDKDPWSLFQIEIPAEQVVEGARWSVRLVDEDSAQVEEGVASSARWPNDGATVTMGAQSDGAGLKLVLVPVQYNTDSSGRLPDMSEEQQKVYKDLLTAVYPLVHVELKIHDAVPFDAPLKFGDMNFDALNEQLVSLKEADGSPSYEYYFGLVNPADTFNKYCSYSCVTGQSYVVETASDGTHRVGAGVGFTGEESAWTLVHELGHMHGRGHAPCDVSPADYFPYKGGMIGTWGYDPRSGKFFDPANVADFMSYCDPMWSSDYTFQNIFQRVVAVGAQTYSLPLSIPVPYRFLRVKPDGAFEWGRTVTLSSRPSSRSAPIRFLDAQGVMVREAEAAVVPVSRDGKTSWLIPAAPVAARSVEVPLPAHGLRRVALP